MAEAKPGKAVNTTGLAGKAVHLGYLSHKELIREKLHFFAAIPAEFHSEAEIRKTTKLWSVKLVGGIKIKQH